MITIVKILKKIFKLPIDAIVPTVMAQWLTVAVRWYRGLGCHCSSWAPIREQFYQRDWLYAPQSVESSRNIWFYFQNFYTNTHARLRLLRTLNRQSMSLVLLESISVPVRLFARWWLIIWQNSHRTACMWPSGSLQTTYEASEAHKPGTQLWVCGDS